MQRTYWNPYYVSFSVRHASNENTTQQATNGTEQSANPEEQLDPSNCLDDGFDLGAHGFRIRLAIWEDHVAVGMLVEINQRPLLLLLLWRRRLHARHRHSSWVEDFRLAVLRLPGVIVEVGLPAAHDCERRLRNADLRYVTRNESGEESRKVHSLSRENAGGLKFLTWGGKIMGAQ